jgi:hypothetical protein
LLSKRRVGRTYCRSALSERAGRRRTPSACHKEMEMKTRKWNRLASVSAVAAIATAFAMPALAQTTAHEHGAAAATHTLTLNHGRKWTTDEPLRAGMGHIRGLVEPQLGAAHAGKLTPAQYRELAGRVQAEVGTIVANCRLEPEADAMLHLVIADLGAGTDAMAGRNPELRPALGLVKVAEAVNQYGSHFDHPGFKPIRNVH